MPLRFPTLAAEAYPFPLTIRHLLDAAMITAADQEIVYRDKLRFTYRQMRERVGRLASLLTSLGAEEGTTVAMMDWDSHRYLEAYFAVPMMGAVLQTVNIRLPPAQVAYTLNHASAEIVICHHEFFPLLDALLPSLPNVKAVIAILDGTENALPSYAKGEYETLLIAGDPNFEFRDFDENALATTFYTTGTTGDPKGVCFSHRQLVLHTLVANAPFGAGEQKSFGHGDVYMPLTPMFHVHAWGVPYIATMLGLKQVYPGRYEPDLICRLKTEHHVTYSHCVPTIFQMVLAAAKRTGTDLTGWVMCIGGSALTRSLCEEGRRQGMTVFAGYGMSETAPCIAVTHRRILPAGTAHTEESDVEAYTMSGVPVPLVTARIVDEEMGDVPHDGTSRGELVLRAPWLTPCYVGDERASAALWHGGWMHTQDIATIDGQGYILIRDRLKDVIKTGGEWLASLALEDLVAGVPGVAEIAVIGVPDATWGERPLAIVAVTPGSAAPTLEALNAPLRAAIARGVLSRYAELERVEVVEALPKTSVGKIDKKVLRARFGAPVNFP